MEINQLPKQAMATSTTGCCPKFDPAQWDQQTFIFKDKLFAKATTRSLFYMPLNFGAVMTHTTNAIQLAGAADPNSFVVLSQDPTPWRGEHYFVATKVVPGLDMTELSGTFLTKVFEGPFQKVGAWASSMKELVEQQGKTMQQLYFYYTTCPKCAKVYQKNYVVAFAKVV